MQGDVDAIGRLECTLRAIVGSVGNDVGGVEPRVIMDTLGHSMIGTTLNLYAHVMPVVQRDAAARMDAALRGETP